jgi:hypothetical protein
VEEISEADAKASKPRCIEGARACPPEDCGGPYAFMHLLEVLADKKDPEYKEMKSWVGRTYDPQKFDLEKVNKQLTRLKAYTAKVEW